MFRPPPTIIEIGTDEDMQQFQEYVENQSALSTPSIKQKGIFESPDVKARPRQIISTPTGQIDSPN
ncbi:hypothetical protein TVAG_317860 [Trichomonas vaginalis G3]|uniref:Uncharacterized protein n=1 Tax=Trichomonas vaginalis (strain ATCC PRA-98 / G3) TaxID=412133 RepID=A2F3N3_TRIV3|nr:hypothetical protein TVAGG3_0551550 [Trichomonas vaginalis G3]EAY00501.1 hypothetical protein TVAG_317860 [Trichomonas vaginalis G3]KAI5520541.1 hypothetical protein TVAGG3_0551550 [Trichomonas vaginalis G3]|eukprot:XP_001313430.1 hypothetical protein [Trichomonas vaginalis G3]